MITKSGKMSMTAHEKNLTLLRRSTYHETLETILNKLVLALKQKES